MPTTQQITERLAAGEAVKRLIMTEEAWYGPSAMASGDPTLVKSWTLGVDQAIPSVTTLGEFTIDWHLLRREDRPVMALRVFADGMAALAATRLVNDLPALGPNPTERQVLDLLLRLGFQDVTERVNPASVHP